MLRLTIRLIMLICIMVTGLLYFTTVMSLSAVGDEMVNIKIELERIEKENQALIVDMSQQDYLHTIEDHAKSLGLVSDSYFVYVKIPSTLVVTKR